MLSRPDRAVKGGQGRAGQHVAARSRYHQAMVPPSGEQHVLSHGAQEAIVTEVGATLRSYVEGGRPVCWGFGVDEMCGGSRGQVLAPWPNRLRDGVYEFGGTRAHAPLDEPARQNAIHGLVRWLPWRVVDRPGADVVRLGVVLHPQPAYPFRLRLEIEYRLGDSGLAVTIEATSEDASPVPFGAGFHAYLSPAPVTVDEVRLAVPATTRLLLDERALPVGSEPVAGTPFEVVAGPAPVEQREPIGSLRLDDCLTGMVLDGDGRWRARLAAPGSSGATVVWADAIYRYAMCFTGDTLAGPDRRQGVAVEPMTCPPDALRTGEDLVVLEPGRTFASSWGIVPSGLS